MSNPSLELKEFSFWKRQLYNFEIFTNIVSNQIENDVNIHSFFKKLIINFNKE